MFVNMLLQLISVCVFLTLCDSRVVTLPKKPRFLESAPKINNRPIVGILSQELDVQTYRLCTLATYGSYIAASYVKFVESAGARVVPIRLGQSESYYEKIVSSLNGILLPGEYTTIFNVSSGFINTFKSITTLAVTYDVPIWAICLGFETLILNSISSDIRTRCNINGRSLPLKFEIDYAKSRLFKNAPYEVLKILKTQPVTANFHSWCITLEDAKLSDLEQEWLILSTNQVDNVTYVSSIESRMGKAWGVQFHPEINNFEWVTKSYNHKTEAIVVSQYLGNFFIDQARENHNSFESKKEEMDSLIYNFSPIYTAKNGCPFEQLYVFA